MKLKKIVKLCKDAGVLTIYNDRTRDIQWISDGHAVYPLQGCPVFDEGSFCSTFEINDKQRDKMHITIQDELPEHLDFGDSDNFETVVEELPLYVSYSAFDVVAFKTESGIEFVKREHLAPLGDYSSRDLMYFLRTTKHGVNYFVVKNGFELAAVIMPVKIITDDFMKELRDFVTLAKITAEVDEKK